MVSEYYLKIAIPPRGIPPRIRNLLKEAHKQERKLYVYTFKEDTPFQSKVGYKKRNKRSETCWWMIISTEPIKDYEKRSWDEKSLLRR